MKKTYIYSIFFFMQCLANIPQPGQGVWDILVNTECFELTIDSKLEDFSSDFSGIFTALNIINNELIDQISSIDNISIEDQDLFETINSIQSKLEISQSFIKPIESVADLLDNCIGIPITQADAGTTGYTISSPGRYFLAENITFSPASAIPAIEIDSDDVYFDLGGFTITQGNTELGVIGIDVLGGNENIVVTNGTIRNTSGNGLNFQATVNNVVVSNINSLEAGIRPFTTAAVDGISFAETTNCLMENCNASAAADEGLDLDNCDHFIIRNCNFSLNKGDSGVSFGSPCNGIYIENCTMNQNDGAGSTTSGNHSNIVFKGCQFNNNGTWGVGPMFGTSNDNFVFIDCEMLNNGSHGITMPFASRRAVVTNCTIVNNGDNGINVTGAGSDNNFFFRNTLIDNDNTNVNEAASAVNSYLGNYAFSSSGANYNAGGSTINSTAVSTASAFSTQPVFWRNIDATT